MDIKKIEPKLNLAKSVFGLIAAATECTIAIIKLKRTLKKKDVVTGPAGPQGPQGPKGDKGDPGEVVLQDGKAVIVTEKADKKNE